MRIRAVAAASAESNAVGTLELECSPRGLLVVYLGVGSYSEGYAPGATTSGTQLVVPWAAVEEVRTTDRHVFITLSSETTPHSKLCLTHFTSGDAPSAAELLRRKRILWFAVAALTATVSLSVGAGWRQWSAQTSQVSALLVGAASGLTVLLMGLFLDRLVLGAGPSSEEVQRHFLAELAHHRPKPLLRGPPNSAPAPEPTDWGELIRVVPRSTLAVIIVFTAGTLAAVLTSSWLLRAPEPRTQGAPAPAKAPQPEPVAVAAPPIETSAAAPATAPTAAPPASSAVAPSLALETVAMGDACTCTRASSALWALEFPRMSTLLIEQRSRTHKEHQHLELELAVINNGSKTLDEVNLLVQFYENDGKKPTKDRPLHYGAPLRPAQAIKWHVEARGTSFSVVNRHADVLPDDRKEMSSADGFAELLRANHRPVRLHGAMMLAYLGDDRAKGGAVKLREALREAEGPYLDRVLATRGDLITCDWRASEQGRVRQVSACVFNVTSKPIERIGVKARALDRLFDYRNPIAAPPVVIAEKLVRLPDPIGAAQGTQAVIALDTDNPDGKVPEAFEVFADLAELL